MRVNSVLTNNLPNVFLYPSSAQWCTMGIMLQQQLYWNQSVLPASMDEVPDSLRSNPDRTFLTVVPSFCLVMAWRVSVRRARLQQQFVSRLLVTSSLLFFLSLWAGAIRPSPPFGYSSLRDPFIYDSASLQSRGLLNCSCFA
jgi:hypothetical protein